MPQFDAFGKLIPDQQLIAGIDPRMQVSPELQLQDIQAAELPAGGKSVIRRPAGEAATKASAFAPAYSEQLDQAFNANVGLREEQLNQLREKLAATEAAKPTGLQAVNLKPLAAFADSLTGGNSAQNFQEETNAMKNYKLDRQKLQDSIEKNSGGLADDQLAYLRMKAQEEAQNRRDERYAAAASRSSEGEESRVRREYLGNPAIKGMNDVDASYRGIASNPGMTGPDQQAFVYQFSKLMDPGSVVRETEYAASAANAGKINQVMQWAEAARSGKALTPQQIRDMKTVAENIYKSYRQKVEGLNKYYGDLAQRKGFDPRNVIADVTAMSPAPSANVKEWKGKKYSLQGDTWVEVK